MSVKLVVVTVDVFAFVYPLPEVVERYTLYPESVYVPAVESLHDSVTCIPDDIAMTIEGTPGSAKGVALTSEETLLSPPEFTAVTTK